MLYNLVPLYTVLLQNSHLCKGLPVTSYMLYPIQRIPRYRLLLEGKCACLHDSKSGLSKNGGTEDCWGTCKDEWTCFHGLCPLWGLGAYHPSKSLNLDSLRLRSEGTISFDNNYL